MASAAKVDEASDGKKIPLLTFRKWNVSDIFDIKKETIDGATYVVKFFCKVCTNYVDQVERDPKMKGVARSQIRTYVDGTTYIIKHNVNRHIIGKVSLLTLQLCIYRFNTKYRMIRLPGSFVD